MQDRNCLKILKCKIWKVVVFFPLPKDNEFAVIMLYGQKFALYPLAGHIKFKFSLKKKKKIALSLPLLSSMCKTIKMSQYESL